MKRVILALLACAGLLVTPVIAGSTAKSPLLGHWKLDVSRLAMPPEARPRSVDLVFRGTRDAWHTRVEIVDQAANTMYSDSTLSLDGTPGRASGTYWVDVLAASMPAPNVLIMQFVFQGIPRSTRVFSVDTSDRSVMTESETYFTEDGTPVTRTAFYRRSTDIP
jgi:hypothetical protein